MGQLGLPVRTVPPGRDLVPDRRHTGGVVGGRFERPTKFLLAPVGSSWADRWSFFVGTDRRKDFRQWVCETL